MWCGMFVVFLVWWFLKLFLYRRRMKPAVGRRAQSVLVGSLPAVNLALVHASSSGGLAFFGILSALF